MSRKLLGLVLFATGCFPSAAFIGSSVSSLDCKSGAFLGELKIERSGARKVKLRYEVLPGTLNVTELSHDPATAVLKGKDNKQGRVQVRGRLEDRCAVGGVNLMASYAPSGTSGFVEIEPVLPVDTPASVSSESDGGFEYALTLQCCGAEGAGTFGVAVSDATGASGVTVEPATVECVGDETHEVTVRGSLEGASSAQIGLSIEDRTTGAVCQQTDAVTRPG